jgi:formate-dependent phosphoribosylglycinamide formyltransferase (GAR transformylase)
MITYLHKGFGMKDFHLSWDPHTLVHDEKTKRVRHAQTMIEALGSHSQTGFKYMLTGNES